MKIQDIMLSTDKFPVMKEDVFLKETLEEMSNKKIGIACIVDDQYQLKGIITDGDVRRKLLKVQSPLSSFFIADSIEHAIVNPTVITPDISLDEAILIMENKQIWDIPVVDDKGKLVGLLHLHPAVKALLLERNTTVNAPQ